MQQMDFNLDNKVWVLVADGEKALFFENAGTRKSPDFKVVRELNQDEPPIDIASGGNSRNDDWYQLAEDRFAKDAAELLYKYAHRNRFNQIVLCASPRVLGELRKELHPEVADKVIGEVSKTLTNHPVDQIERILSAN